MNIIIKSNPYETENVLGGLFVGLSTGDAGEPTNVIFLEDGLHCLYANQNSDQELAIPSISDLIRQLIGVVRFYAILSEDMKNEGWLLRELKTQIVPGIKWIDYSQLIVMIRTDKYNPIIL